MKFEKDWVLGEIDFICMNPFNRLISIWNFVFKNVDGLMLDFSANKPSDMFVVELILLM
jgi:hypothetical protein